MKRTLLTILAISGLVLAVAKTPKSSSLPDIPNNEIRHFKTYYASPKDRPDMDIPAQRALHLESPKFYTEMAEWIGDGPGRKLKIIRRDKLYNTDTLESEFLLSAGSEFTMIRSRRTWRAPNGDVIREREHEFIDPSFGYPKQTYHLMVVPWLLRLSHLEPKAHFDWYVWLDSYFVYPIVLEVDGEDRIKTEAGEFDCWRCVVQLNRKKIDDIMGAIVARSQGKFVMWFDKNSANGLVRLVYPISSGAPGQPMRLQTQDLVKVEQ